MDGPTTEALRLLLKEAKDHLAGQLAVIDNLDEKTAQLIRFDAIIVGLGITVASLLVSRGSPLSQVPGWALALLVGGAVSIGLSMLVSLAAYWKRDITVGLAAVDLERSIEFEATEDGVLREAIRAYRYGIEDNQRINARTSRLFDGALALLILGLQLLISMAVGLTVLMQRGG